MPCGRGPRVALVVRPSGQIRRRVAAALARGAAVAAAAEADAATAAAAAIPDWALRRRHIAMQGRPQPLKAARALIGHATVAAAAALGRLMRRVQGTPAAKATGPASTVGVGPRARSAMADGAAAAGGVAAAAAGLTIRVARREPAQPLAIAAAATGEAAAAGAGHSGPLRCPPRPHPLLLLLPLLPPSAVQALPRVLPAAAART